MGKLSDSDFEGFEVDWDEHLCDRDYIYSLIDNVEWESQLRAISLLLQRNRAARKEASEEIKQNESELRSYNGPHHDHYVDQHVFLLHETVYQDAAESMAAIGMIAPMVESILCQSLAALGRMHREKNKELPAQKRWMRANKIECKWEDLWNCQKYFNRENEIVSNFIDGFPQLADACGLEKYLPADFMVWFRAMFTYRNFMFHGGFEWSIGNRRKFTREIKEKGWQSFFTCATSDDEPWIYYLKTETIEEMPIWVEKMLDSLGAFAKDLPSELTSDQ
ncbi:Uncharacterised protein [Pannonibacter phragmitetus]|uniref:Uncharacterized protein n=1 Tax=Pannonibacter phragmitetus TaxID=121719 RepID=A0A378ZYU0_9HYPH|nr:hypothetical protein [Pannonibacter phragmitetus]SUB02248.1 Uncharacterised protein [Pannonibacter phragmitetus]